MSEFVSAPPPSSGVPWAELEGQLLVIEPLSFEPQVSTTNGIKDAVRANVYALRSPTESEDFEDALIFGAVLMPQAKRSLGLKLAGRLIKGKADPGKNAPWILDAATPDDLAKAAAWQAARAASGFTSAPPPAAPAAAPPRADQGWASPVSAPSQPTLTGAEPPF